jgi:hypothetical protein
MLHMRSQYFPQDVAGTVVQTHKHATKARISVLALQLGVQTDLY